MIFLLCIFHYFLQILILSIVVMVSLVRESIQIFRRLSIETVIMSKLEGII